jgi:hypothetical protein
MFRNSFINHRIQQHYIPIDNKVTNKSIQEKPKEKPTESIIEAKNIEKLENKIDIVPDKSTNDLKEEKKKIKEEMNKKLDSIMQIVADKKDQPSIQTNDEIYKFLTEKFSKMDDALIEFKKTLDTPKAVQYYEESDNSNESDGQMTLLTKKTIRSEPQKIIKGKNKHPTKSYAAVTDQMFEEIKQKYPHVSEAKKEVFCVDNDGNFYINDKSAHRIKPVNNVNTIKLIKKNK